MFRCQGWICISCVFNVRSGTRQLWNSFLASVNDALIENEYNCVTLINAWLLHDYSMRFLALSQRSPWMLAQQPSCAKLEQDYQETETVWLQGTSAGVWIPGSAPRSDRSRCRPLEQLQRIHDAKHSHLPLFDTDEMLFWQQTFWEL